MANTFELVGKISIGKESEKFKPYETFEYDSGWNRIRLLFNIQAGTNRHMLESQAMYKPDGTGVVYTFTKSETDPKTHEKKKGENIQIPWKDRHKPEVIEKVAEFKKFVVDLEEYGRRYKIKDALEKQEKGESVEEELKELGVDDLKKALEESEAKRKEFIHEYDFTEFLHKLVKSDKYKNKKFKITGEITYRLYNGNVYKSLVPKRVYLVPNDEKEVSTGQLTVFFNKDSLDENSYAKDKKYYLNVFVRNYDSQLKQEIPVPIQLVIDDTKENDKVQKFTQIMKKQFTVEDGSWKEFGVKVKLLNGSQEVELTDDMLTEYQKDMLELGLITKEEIKKELGGEIYGDKIEEMVIVNSIRGYSKGRKDTVFIDSDFELPETVVKEDSSKTSSTDELFDDLEDIL